MRAMTAFNTMIRGGRWDSFGMGLAGLCLVHCLGTAVLLALISSAGGLLLDPLIHEVGLILAIIFGALALIQGVLAHGFMLPAAIGGLGIGTMAGAAAMPHGQGEIMMTVIGVAILAFGHSLNQRAGG
jgi:MerC mercury resistance protein